MPDSTMDFTLQRTRQRRADRELAHPLPRKLKHRYPDRFATWGSDRTDRYVVTPKRAKLMSEGEWERTGLASLIG